MQRFGSSKPVSASELNEARSALRLLKDHMKTDPPKYFPGAIDDFQPSQPPSNFRKAFKPSVQNQPPPAQAKPIKHQYRQPTNMAKESESGVAVYDFEAALNADPADAGALQECPDCGRKFNADALEKHSRICKKVFLNKRKPFNSSEQRETDQMSVATPAPAKGAPNRRINPAIPVKGVKEAKGKDAKGKWKMQSEQFRANLRAAKMAEDGTEGYEEAAKQAAAMNSQSLTPCPHCGRTFNDEAAARHIPICARKAKEAQFKKGGKRK